MKTHEKNGRRGAAGEGVKKRGLGERSSHKNVKEVIFEDDEDDEDSRREVLSPISHREAALIKGSLDIYLARSNSKLRF